MNKELNTVDKGFELRYDRLSHRRKFIRTLWVTVLGIIVPLLDFYMMAKGIHPIASNVIHGFALIGVLVLILITGSIQAVYEYKKWKTEE